ncbi:vacuolar protein sorting-associated protein 36 [Moesziomyces antarcticus]|uniref:Vacuolar protein-sorting-associated protein 36 n=2 Tax=Pseudozyma antarctica TaxID=84753 RepID=A0A081CGD7_PSEA2|nr:vacuolar protein sorting-associated protein 36 [Moesziomyces antarcticus]GAK65733.1 vacuolar protein sorting-associated protein 36 [Moesziomyces antarcticus]SPO45359.1 related to VPS36 protein, involved in vacuolar protein sorting [Moesziomyces antarcticus]
MDRFKQIDASNSSIGALLFHDEEVVSLQDGIGLYDGKEKALHQSNGTVYLTSHRLLYVDDLEPHRHSCSLDLSYVKQSEYYAGFLKSSPKITLTLAKVESTDDDSSSALHLDTNNAHRTSAPRRPSPLSSQADLQPANTTTGRDWRVGATAADSSAAAVTGPNWVCAICGFSNAAGRSSCELCGVTKEPARPTPTRTPVPERPRPSERLSFSNDGRDSPAPNPSTSSSASGITTEQGGLACDVCTFLNHPSMDKCEMCGSSLGNSWPERPSTSSLSTSRKSTDADVASLRASSAPSRASTPASISLPPLTDSVKLSFRKGGDKAFYSLLKSTLKGKAWAASSSTATSSANDARAVRVSAGMVDLDGRSAALKRVGIDGILSSVDSTSRAQNDDMHGALKDLEALMRKAKQMVEFAEALNAKLTKQEQAAAAAQAAGRPEGAAKPDQEAATLIRSSLVQLGLPTPAVTADMARDQEEYHRELARELAGLLLGNPSGGQRQGLMGAGRIAAKGKGKESLPRVSEDELKGRGLLGLDEVWCVWNRARGVALIPPQALRSAAAFLPDITSPSVRIKTFKSGLSVLHTPRYSDDAFASRILHLLDALEWEHRMKRIEQAQALTISDRRSGAAPIADAPDGTKPARLQEEVSYGDNLSPWGAGASILEIAEKEDVPILLINEMMEMIEAQTGMVVRDDGGPNGTRWFVNHFARL